MTSSSNTDDLGVNSDSNFTQENTDELSQRAGIFERDDKKLAFVHHKKEVVISNFTTKVVSFFEASNVAGYIFEVASNERTWQCALTLGQLCDSRVVLGILQNHCQDALWYRVPRDAPSYVDLGAYMFRQTDQYRLSGDGLHRKVATIYPAWQSCGTFVVSNNLQINAKTRMCLPIEDRYVLYEKSWTKNRGKGASAGDATVPVVVKQPFTKNGISNLLLAFEGLLSNNYPAACLALGGTVMSLGYQRIIQAGGSCPVVLLTGDTETSKTTVLKACLSITGNSEAKDFTAKKALDRSKKCDIPYAWDDPSSKDDPDGTDLFNFINGYRSWANYLTDMEQDGTWGDHVILYAAANCFDTFIHVISSQSDHRDITIRPYHHVISTNPLVLGHVHEVHYLSLKPRQEDDNAQGKSVAEDDSVQTEHDAGEGFAKEDNEAGKQCAKQTGRSAKGGLSKTRRKNAVENLRDGLSVLEALPPKRSRKQERLPK